MRLYTKIPALYLMAAAAMTSCSDLIYDGECPPQQLDVNFLWSEEQRPEGMTVWFFSTDANGSDYRFDIASPAGGKVSLPVGNYKMLTVNNDAKNVAFTHEDSFDDYTASVAKEDHTWKTADDEEALVTPPGMLWATTIGSVNISVEGATYGYITDSRRIWCHPEEICARYHVEVRSVENLKSAKAVQSALSGLSATVNVGEHTLSDTDITESLTLKADSDNSLTGDLLTFGKKHDDPTHNFLVIRFRMSDGSIHEVTTDVTEQIVNAPDPMNVDIIIDDITLPDTGEEPPIPGEGLDVTVGDWIDIEIYV